MLWYNKRDGIFLSSCQCVTTSLLLQNHCNFWYNGHCEKHKFVYLVMLFLDLTSLWKNTQNYKSLYFKKDIMKVYKNEFTDQVLINIEWKVMSIFLNIQFNNFKGYDFSDSNLPIINLFNTHLKCSKTLRAFSQKIISFRTWWFKMRKTLSYSQVKTIKQSALSIYKNFRFHVQPFLRLSNFVMFCTAEYNF